MGMFNYVVCRYPLPLEGANDRVYQTKDIGSPELDTYEIRSDGTLWHERREYDANGEVSGKQWVHSGESGDVWFHDFARDNRYGWIEWKVKLDHGKLVGQPELFRYEP